MDCSLPGSSVHGIFQARVLEWVATPLLSSNSWTEFLPLVLPSSLTPSPQAKAGPSLTFLSFCSCSLGPVSRPYPPHTMHSGPIRSRSPLGTHGRLSSPSPMCTLGRVHSAASCISITPHTHTSCAWPSDESLRLGSVHLQDLVSLLLSASSLSPVELPPSLSSQNWRSTPSPWSTVKPTRSVSSDPRSMCTCPRSAPLMTVFCFLVLNAFQKGEVARWQVPYRWDINWVFYSPITGLWRGSSTWIEPCGTWNCVSWMYYLVLLLPGSMVSSNLSLPALNLYSLFCKTNKTEIRQNQKKKKSPVCTLHRVVMWVKLNSTSEL